MESYKEQWWDDTDREKPKNSEKKPVPVPFVHHKSHVD
jgi:hypothetical protein